MIDNLMLAFPAVFSWEPLLSILLGTVGGIVIGALPGLTATMGIAVLIPVTFTLDPIPALGMIAGVFQGATYGGSIPAILLRIPGTPTAIATVFDGYPMARQGKAAQAMIVALVSSSIGGMASAVVLILVAPPLADFALEFGPAEYFWLAVFGLSSISMLLGSSPEKGLLSACFGLFVGLVGIDTMTGHERFTFDYVYLVSGFHIVVLLTGLYALPPAIRMAEEAIKEGASPEILRVVAFKSRLRDWGRYWTIWLRSSIIGIIIGIIPGAGGNMAALLSWNEAKRFSKKPELFGTGIPEGIAAAECANNADTSSALIPAITLGVPGNAVAAVILGALLVHGLRPGPQLFVEDADVIYGFMLQMFLSAVVLFVVGRFGIRFYVQVLRIPPLLLAVMIVPLTFIGVYSIQNSLFDVWMCLGFGVIGYFMEKLDISVAPAVLALILGPMAEINMRRVVVISHGDLTAFIDRPIAIVLFAMTLAALFYPLLSGLRKRKEAEASAERKA